MAGFLGGLFSGNDKEDKAKQEQIGKAMQSLSDQIAALQQQGKGKDGEIDTLKAELAQAQALEGAGDQAKKALMAAQSALAVAEADKQASDMILQNAQKQIAELQAQLHQLEATAAAAPAAAVSSAAVGGLVAGAAAWVREEGGKGLRRRSAPGLSSDVLDALAPGTQLALLEGPSDADGHHWWKVRVADGREGWVAGEELVVKPE
ncbi:MAG: SH3 domain-containing protein [Roseiflexaceae bacterium]|nr:SH3 domain-containing protein [Roseiflexaceae bacterium]